jgi:hypothetical protein
LATASAISSTFMSGSIAQVGLSDGKRLGDSIAAGGAIELTTWRSFPGHFAIIESATKCTAAAAGAWQGVEATPLLPVSSCPGIAYQTYEFLSGPTLRRRQAKLARSVGASPTQVMPSRQPGGKCCVSRRRRRPRRVHSGCVGCVIEPRYGSSQERRPCRESNATRTGPAKRGHVRPAGVEEQITQNDRVGTWKIPRSARAFPLLVRIGKGKPLADDERTRKVRPSRSGCAMPGAA